MMGHGNSSRNKEKLQEKYLKWSFCMPSNIGQEESQDEESWPPLQQLQLAEKTGRDWWRLVIFRAPLPPLRLN